MKALLMFWLRIVRRFDRFTEDARRNLVEATLWFAERLRGPRFEIVLDETDLEVLTPRSLRRLEREVPTFAFPRRPLSEAVVRAGWMHVGQATILGLGAPTRAVDPRDNRRVAEPEPTFMR